MKIETSFYLVLFLLNQYELLNIFNNILEKNVSHKRYYFMPYQYFQCFYGFISVRLNCINIKIQVINKIIYFINRKFKIVNNFIDNKITLLRSIFFGKNKKKFKKSIDYCPAIIYNIIIGGEVMKDKFEEFFEILDLIEKLVIKLISLFGWIAILILTIKGMF